MWRTYYGLAQTETVVETVTVLTQAGGGAVTETTSERVFSSEALPVSCFVQDQPLASTPFGYFAAPFEHCARYDLFTAAPTSPVQPSAAVEACLARLAEANGKKTCTTTGQRLGDVVGATATTRDYRDPFTDDVLTGTSRKVQTVETTYSTHKGEISSTERVLSSGVLNLNCRLDTKYRGFPYGSESVELSKCAELGLSKAQPTASGAVMRSAPAVRTPPDTATSPHEPTSGRC